MKKRKFRRGGGLMSLEYWGHGGGGGNAFWNFWRHGGVKIWKPSVVGYGYFLELPIIWRARWKQGRKWLFLTDLCFSWFKIDPACPSYHCWLTFSPRTLFQRRTLGLAARKMMKPPFFKLALKTQSCHRCSRTLLRSIEAYDPTQR